MLRVILLVRGRFAPGGGGGKASSFQSPEPRGGKITPGTFGGRPLGGDRGVGSAFASSVSWSGLLSDTEAIELVISLEQSQLSAVGKGLVEGKRTLTRMNVGSPTADTRP